MSSSDDVVDGRLGVVRRLVDGPEPSDDAAFVPSAAEELRRKLSGCLRSAARHRRLEAADGSSDVTALIKGWYGGSNKIGCGEVLDHLGALCGSWMDYEELVECVDGLAAGGKISYAALKEYVVNNKGERLVELVARIRRSVEHSDPADVFDKLTEKRKKSGNGRTISTAKLHRWVWDHVDVDLTRMEVNAVLRTMNELAGVAENGPDVDKSAFCQFVKTESVVKKLKKALAEPPASVVDVQVSVSRLEEDDLRAHGYEPVLDPVQSSSGSDAPPPCDLVKGGGSSSSKRGLFGGDRVSLWILRKRGTRLRPIVDMRLETSKTNTALAVVGYSCLEKKSLNSRLLGPSKYLWIARSRNVSSESDIMEVRVTVGRASVLDDPIHLAPDRRKEGGSFRRVTGGPVGGGGSSAFRDVHIWFRRRRGTQAAENTIVKPAAIYAQWSPYRRRLECEIAARYATRAHAPPTNTGAPDLSGLFFRHALKTSGKLGKPEFARLVRDVGFNLEPADRDVLMSRLAVASNAEVSRLDLDDFRQFFSLADHELDRVAADLRQCVRRSNTDGGLLSNVLDQLNSLGGSNLTLAELGYALRRVGHFLTTSEISRLAKRWSTTKLDGEIDSDAFLQFLQTATTDDDDARRSAARVQLAADSLRSYLLDAPKHFSAIHSRLLSSRGGTATGDQNVVSPAETAWTALTQRRARRLRRFAGVPIMMSKKKLNRHRLIGEDDRAATEALSLSSSDFLEADDLALTLERQLQFSGNDRLSPTEYGQLVTVVAPTNNHVDFFNFRAFTEASFRPVAELLRIVDHRLLKVSGDLLALYRASSAGEDILNSTAEYRACLFDTLSRLRLVDEAGFPKRLTIDKLRRELVKSSSAVTETNESAEENDGALSRVSLSEWSCLAQHTGADVERPLTGVGDGKQSRGYEVARVDAKEFVEGLCRLVADDSSTKASLLPILKPTGKSDRRLNVATRDLARHISRRGADLDFGDWLRSALAKRDLPSRLPAPAKVFSRLLQAMNQDYGWQLDAQHLNILSKSFESDAAQVDAVQVEEFLNRHRKRFPENPDGGKKLLVRSYDDMEDDSILDRRIRHILESRDIVALERVFEKYDPDLLGKVAVKHFMAIASRIGLWENLDEVTRLAYDLDRHRDGTVDYREFCRRHVAARLLGRDAEEDSPQVHDVRLWRLAQPVAAALHAQQQNGLDLDLPFKMKDPNDTGLVSLRDFRATLRRFDIPANDSDIDQLADAFKPPGRPNDVDYNKFLKFLAATSSSNYDTATTTWVPPPPPPFVVYPRGGGSSQYQWTGRDLEIDRCRGGPVQQRRRRVCDDDMRDTSKQYGWRDLGPRPVSPRRSPSDNFVHDHTTKGGGNVVASSTSARSPPVSSRTAESRYLSTDTIQDDDPDDPRNMLL